MIVNNQDQLLKDIACMVKGIKKQALGEQDNAFNEMLGQLTKVHKVFSNPTEPTDEEELGQNEKGEDEYTCIDSKAATMIVHSMIQENTIQELGTGLELVSFIGQEQHTPDSPRAEVVQQIRGPDIQAMSHETHLGLVSFNTAPSDWTIDGEHVSGNNVIEPSMLFDGSDESVAQIESKLVALQHTMQADNVKEQAEPNKANEVMLQSKLTESETWDSDSYKKEANRPSEAGELLPSDLSSSKQPSHISRPSTVPKEHSTYEFNLIRQQNPEHTGLIDSLRNVMDDTTEDLEDGKKSSLHTQNTQQTYVTTTATDSLQARGTTIHNLPEIASKMSEKISTLKSGDSTELKVWLEPEILGKVEIKLRRKGSDLLGEISVESMAAKEAIENGIKGLKSRLMEQDIQLEHISISLKQDGGADRQMGQGPTDNKGWTNNTHFASGKQDTQTNASLHELQYEKGMGVSLNLLI